MDLENKDLEQVDEEVVIETTEAEEENKTFTQDEVDKLLQSEADKRVSSALSKAKEKWQVEYSEKLEVEKAEAEKLAAMTQDERIQAEVSREREAFELERTTFMKEKMEMEAIKGLSAEKLPTNFVPFVVASTQEQVKENINIFKEVWSEAINEAVNSKLVGKVPVEGNVPSSKVMTKQEFSKLKHREREVLFANDPDILNKLK